MHSSQSPVF